MTPIEKMEAAAREHPRTTMALSILSHRDRERYVERLQAALKEEGMHGEVTNLYRILGYVEMQTLVGYYR
ncbi:MAG TPA: hypothetical protein VNM40_00650 [Candidatus Paceibacterota bacterium]|nr:hypothetical protein [Candidatus Paceibacterota bacterium]